MAANSVSYTSQDDVFAARRARFSASDVDTGAHIPILTFSLIVVLTLIFGIELRCAVDIEGAGPLGIQSLIALGAAGYDRIFIDGEYWRALLAPLLHRSYSHLIGNAFALFCIGIKLEPLVGKPWFAAIFVLSALGGMAGSLIGNPHEVVTVGASGAISGLIGALFAGSFSRQAERLDQRAMRISALRFGVPALGPLLYGASGHTDYHAHLGGALTGAAIALGLASIAAAGRPRPVATPVGVSFVGTAASALAMLFAIHAYHGATVARLPATWKMENKSTETFPPNYQTDPRARIARAMALDGRGATLAAEMELRDAMALASHDSEGRRTHELARTLLAISAFKDGRRWEAWRTAGDICGGAGRGEHRRLLQKAKVCD